MGGWGCDEFKCVVRQKAQTMCRRVPLIPAVCSGRPLHVFSCAFHVPLFNSIPTITVGELSHFHC